ncbi:MAG: hypothetical protein JNG88_11085 [Phycisphaerales bacterium]|nr:hypothetical protein [Phycisphaerales bacterium]
MKYSNKFRSFVTLAALSACGFVAVADEFGTSDASQAKTAANTSVTGGTLNIQLDGQSLQDNGILQYFPQSQASFAIRTDSGFYFRTDSGMAEGINTPGQFLQTSGLLPMFYGEDATLVGDFRVMYDGIAWRVIDTMYSQRDLFDLNITETQFDANSGTLLLGGEIAVSPLWAIEFGATQASGAIVGTFALAGTAEGGVLPAGVPMGGGGVAGGCTSSPGPDVIVGDLTGPQNYTAANGYEALAIGSYSCNIGNVWLNWFADTNQHPVIGGNLFKLKQVDGSWRFEQIGQSWLKHGFFALSNTLCCTCEQPTDGTHLGVGCADPYTAARNGSQGGLGPKWQVNASSGVFTYPPANPSYSGQTARRLQVRTTDLEPSSSSIRYYGSCMYVTPDDAAAGNKNNNESYRQVTVSGSGSAWTFGFTGSTQRMQAGIRAWQDSTNNVTEVVVDLTGDGRYIIAYQVTDLGNNTWHYEYAVYNQNSHRSARTFSIPIPAGVTVTNIGFHDVEYLNGDGPSNVNYSGTDWAAVVADGAITWSTETFEQNQSANALRWGTLYNFRFDANVGPTRGNATIGLFRPGTPTDFVFDANVPLAPITAPEITGQPTGGSICAGAAFQFSVTATGDGLSYQWRKDTVNIPGATNSTYNIAAATYADRGSYDVVVTNAGGSTTSAAAALLVTVKGDANGDGLINNFDIDAFVVGLSDGEATYESQYNNEFGCALDINGDGAVNNFDLDPFVECLLNGACP